MQGNINQVTYNCIIHTVCKLGNVAPNMSRLLLASPDDITRYLLLFDGPQSGCHDKPLYIKI